MNLIEEALGRDFEECLEKLKKKGVYHSDMLKYGIITEQEEKEYREQNSTND